MVRESSQGSAGMRGGCLATRGSCWLDAPRGNNVGNVLEQFLGRCQAGCRTSSSLSSVYLRGCEAFENARRF